MTHFKVIYYIYVIIFTILVRVINSHCNVPIIKLLILILVKKQNSKAIK